MDSVEPQTTRINCILYLFITISRLTLIDSNYQVLHLKRWVSKNLSTSITSDCNTSIRIITPTKPRDRWILKLPTVTFNILLDFIILHLQSLTSSTILLLTSTSKCRHRFKSNELNRIRQLIAIKLRIKHLPVTFIDVPSDIHMFFGKFISL